MTKEDFIQEHVTKCQCKPAKKYDPKKPNAGYHSLAYSRRKCAKQIWKQRQKRLSTIGISGGAS